MSPARDGLSPRRWRRVRRRADLPEVHPDRRTRTGTTRHTTVDDYASIGARLQGPWLSDNRGSDSVGTPLPHRDHQRRRPDQQTSDTRDPAQPLHHQPSLALLIAQPCEQTEPQHRPHHHATHGRTTSSRQPPTAPTTNHKAPCATPQHNHPHGLVVIQPHSATPAPEIPLRSECSLMPRGVHAGLRRETDPMRLWEHGVGVTPCVEHARTVLNGLKRTRADLQESCFRRSARHRCRSSLRKNP
ncbi:hypothetical protein DFR72_108123 [Lentzea flaviverrucosa]|uniref:Uncharacterized protein n=1 Tax=Lentzea flaviverrucosa TaxID=200379 RepID=A0A1H9SLV0_9PSEU|nr:hypothetical protein DFR72_108123 [Lentzea flaviverrucosa]SER85982.1 hypothetical protein SAMN05216195_107124 [Lentzea flaviverrucosa]